MAGCDLLELAFELLVKILHNCDLKSLLSSNCTCHRLHDVITSSVAFQYKVALGANGLVDNSHAVLSISEKINKLRRYESIWSKKGDRAKGTHAELIKVFAMPLDYAVFLQLSSDLWGYCPGQSEASGSKLIFHRLPSPLFGTEESTWELSFPFLLFDVDWDATQDALILYEKSPDDRIIRVRFLSLHSGQPHPLANTAAYEPEEGWALHDMSGFRGDYVYISQRRIDEDPNTAEENPGVDLVFHNWKSGKVVSRIPSVLCRPPKPNSACFLDDHRILHCHIIDHHSSSQPILDVYDILHPHYDPRSRPILHLLLPILADQWTPTSVACWCPASRWQLDPGTAPFMMDEEDDLLIVDYHQATLTEEEPLRIFCLVLRPSLVSTFIHADGGCFELPWEKWGPACSRLMPQGRWGMSDIILSPPNSMRTCAWARDGLEENAPKNEITVYDFHPRRVAHTLADPMYRHEASRSIQEKGDEWWNDLEELHSVFPTLDPAVAREGIPYTVQTVTYNWSLPEDAESLGGVQLTDEGIFGLSLGADKDDGWELQLYTIADSEPNA